MQVLSMFVARLLVAAILGAASDLSERRSTSRLDCGPTCSSVLGAAMYTILSRHSGGGTHWRSHPHTRREIIPGIGFIGAGSIMRSGMTVSGLTTAATMFVVASIGMAVGGGLFIPAIFATLLILLSLELLGRFEQRFNLKPALMRYEVLGPAADTIITDVNRLLEADHIAM